MKNLYVLLICFCMASTMQAQEVISACNDSLAGGIQIIYDYSLNCPTAPGDLSAYDTLGFHSGGNQWASVIDWDNAAAVNAVRIDTADVYRVYLADPAAYYNLATLDNIFFVSNQGPGDSANPWSSEGKEDDGNGGCADFSVTIADITETCATSVATTSIEELRLDKQISIAPNPFDLKTVISIDNPTREAYTVTITNMSGQTVKRVANFQESELEIERGNLSSGMYLVRFQNEKGQFASQRMLIK